MKICKSIALILALCLLFSALAACGASQQPAPEPAPQVTEPAPETPAEPQEPALPEKPEAPEVSQKPEKPAEPTQPEGPISVTDMAGAAITLEQPAARIVALQPADCELLYAIGAQEALVGRGADCAFPEAVSQLPVAGVDELGSVESIVTLSPELLLVPGPLFNDMQLAALQNAGIQVVNTGRGTIKGVYKVLEFLGALTGRAQEAQAVTHSMEMIFEDVAFLAQDLPEGRTVYFELGTQEVTREDGSVELCYRTPGGNNYLDEIAELLNLTNIFHREEGFLTVTQEDIRRMDPDIIVTLSGPDAAGNSPLEELAQRKDWDTVTAVARNQMLPMAGREFAQPGPRLADGAELLLQFLLSLQS